MTLNQTLADIESCYLGIGNGIDSGSDSRKKIQRCIRLIKDVVDTLDITEYLLIDADPALPRKNYTDLYYKLGTLYKIYADADVVKKVRTMTSTDDLKMERLFYHKALGCFNQILKVEFVNQDCYTQMVSIYTHLCLIYESTDLEMCVRYLKEALLYTPDNATIHYNLAYIYQKLNRLEPSLIHHGISIKFIEHSLSDDTAYTSEFQKLLVSNYNGVACIYRSVKNWPTALFYLRKAEAIAPDDSEVCNSLGVVYTEMRRTDLAEKCYRHAISNINKASSPANIYLNYGHMHSYNGDNHKAIECYNQSLKYSPNFNLPFQNKLMNLNYLFNEFTDKMYIKQQHQLVNRLYKKGRYPFDNQANDDNKINIGFVSGDFVEHPVSYFISAFLKNYDTSRFNVTCYSQCMIDTSVFKNNVKATLIVNLSSKEAADIIYADKIDILIDLSGHTASNRLDVFALRPAPVQITYIGYPYSTGLDEMDYRITDAICDNDSVSSAFYTEKLLYLPDCFLCYDTPILPPISAVPEISVGGEDENYLQIGCFNRLNKITDDVLQVFNRLLSNRHVKFVFKTKAFLNKDVRKTFLEKFDEGVRERIAILDCTNSHTEHLSVYNTIDIAIDTFPYSGTTTSCEALSMGVPVFSFYDDIYYFHAQNVTSSILKNSGLEEYIVKDEDQLHSKIEHLVSLKKSNDPFWKTIKTETREKFLSGKVCDTEAHVKNISALFERIVIDT